MVDFIPPEENRLAGSRAVSSFTQHVDGIAASAPHSAHHDAVVDDEVLDHRDLIVDGADLLEPDDLVEFKSTMVVYGDNQRIGRISFRKGQHQHLLEEDARYAILVCEPDADREVIAATVMTADDVDDHIDSWVDPGDGGPHYSKLAWPNFIDREVVEL